MAVNTRLTKGFVFPRLAYLNATVVAVCKNVSILGRFCSVSEPGSILRPEEILILWGSRQVEAPLIQRATHSSLFHSPIGH